MAVSIRLQRRGATHRPFYHIVATDRRNPRDGRFIEKLGYYNPGTEPSTIEVKEERLQYWYGVGAQVTDSVQKLLKAKKVKAERVQTNAQK